jgi:glycosyltransferase involved in cell wall biosynthesis
VQLYSEESTIVDISIVLCTRNRAARLGAALVSISKQVFDGTWELVIVDNGSTDETGAVVRQFAGSAPFAVRLVHEPAAGLGRARNTGWRAATGDIVAFTDDDCYPETNFLQSVGACFQEEVSLAFLGGRILLHDPEDFPITIQTRADRLWFEPFSVIATGVIQGANFSIRRSTLESVGGFNAALGAGTPFACEDIEILGRMSAHGFAGAYDPRPTVSHHHGRRSSHAVGQLQRDYDTGRGAYYASMLFQKTVRRRIGRRWLSSMLRGPAIVSLRELLGAARLLATGSYR